MAVSTLKKIKRKIKEPSTKEGILVLISMIAVLSGSIDGEVIAERATVILQSTGVIIASIVAIIATFRDEKIDEEDED